MRPLAPSGTLVQSHLPQPWVEMFFSFYCNDQISAKLLANSIAIVIPLTTMCKEKPESLHLERTWWLNFFWVLLLTQSGQALSCYVGAFLWQHLKCASTDARWIGVSKGQMIESPYQPIALSEPATWSALCRWFGFFTLRLRKNKPINSRFCGVYWC